MSGYDVQTGIFELTGTKGRYWFRRSPETAPSECIGLGSYMACFACLFKAAGFEVVKNGGNFLHVRATPEQVWEVLSGEPSNPERAKHYYKNQS